MPEPQQFRKKPVVIEAVQWPTVTGRSLPIDAVVRPIHDWIGDRATFEDYWGDGGMLFGRVRTLEGVMNVSPGDWIIKGVKDEFYPCKPDIFEATYEPA